MAVGDAGGEQEILPLPIAGLMSAEPAREVAEKLGRLNALAGKWGSTLKNPFMALSFMALPVIPELKLTDLGLVDVASFSHVAVFEQE